MVDPLIDALPEPPAGKTGWPWTEASPPMPDTLPGGRPWPRICIVTPSYNQAAFLEETLRSVLLQGYPELDYVVMDGGSEDGSVEILGKYEPWLSFLRTGPDAGQAAAIAEGFERSPAGIMAWLNSDDRYEPGALHRVASYFARHPRVVFVTSNILEMDSKGDQVTGGEYRFIASPCRTLTANLGWHNWPQPGSFWRRWAYEACGGMDHSLHFCMDCDLFLRITALGPARRLKGPPTAAFRYHAEAKTSRMQDVREEEERLIVKRYSHPRLARSRMLLQAWRRLWLLPARLRGRLYSRFGWEL